MDLQGLALGGGGCGGGEKDTVKDFGRHLQLVGLLRAYHLEEK